MAKKASKGSNSADRRGWNLLVLPRFQVWLLIVNLLAVVLTLGVVGYYGLQSFADLKQLGGELNLSPDHPYFKFIETQKSLLFGSFWKASLISIAASSLGLLFVSHRLAGPMIRLRWFFKQLGTEQEVTRKLTFRDGDWVADLPHQVNDALKRVTGGRKPSRSRPGLTTRKPARKKRRHSA